MYQTGVTYGTMKDEYSKHHYLFHMQNLFQNGLNDISEMVNIICRFFVEKIRIFVKFGSSNFIQILPTCGKVVSKELQIVFNILNLCC